MSERSTENLERFSGIIIETLRELSAKRHPLSASFLSKALAKRKDLTHVLEALGGASPSSPSGEPSPHADEESPNSKMSILQTQKDKLLKQIAVLEEKNSQTLAFCKRSLMTLANLNSVPAGNPIHLESLDKFKKLVARGAGLNDLEASMSSLKDLILQDDSNGNDGNTSDTGFLGKWLKKKSFDRNEEFSEGLDLKRLQGSYLSILAEFHLDLGKEYLESFSNLQQHIRETKSGNQLLSLNEDVLALIQTYIRLMNEEKNQVTDFISEIGKSLIEMETNFLASLNHASEAHQSNVDFGNMLEGQMEEIKKSTFIGKTLTEIRGFVASRLTSIKAALESKRQQDQQRMEEIDTEMGAMQQNLQNMRKEIEQVQEQSRSLERETLLDPLTGIPNRRAYDLRIKEEFQRYHRYKHSFSLVLFDVDHFKRVNDNYGHWAGDKCLKEIIKRIKPVMRESDFLARYGGEEFTIILPGTERDSAQGVAERLRRLIEKTHFIFQGQKIPLTISVGVTQIEPADQNQEILFSRVDAAMYQAKRAGRNHVVLV